MKLTIKHIYDFAQSHDIGCDVFLNNRTGEVIELPNPNRIFEVEFEEFYQEGIKKIEANWDDIIKIECPDSSESFEIMSSFADKLEESRLKLKLYTALNNRKPFRNFNHIIHNCEKREEWFEHKRLELEGRVVQLLNL